MSTPSRTPRPRLALIEVEYQPAHAKVTQADHAVIDAIDALFMRMTQDGLITAGSTSLRIVQTAQGGAER